jgi:hypothetical protein
MTAVSQFSPQTLKNRGVPVRVHQLAPPPAAGEGWTRLFDGDGNPLVGEVNLQITNAVLADFEDDLMGWGSLDGWQQGMQTKPFQTIAKTIALIRGWNDGNGRPDYRRAGLAMLDGEMGPYTVAVSAAFAIANGADPTKTSEQLLQQLAQAAAAKAKQDAALDAALAESAPDTPTPPSAVATPGSSGSLPGAGSTDLSKSSGA